MGCPFVAKKTWVRVEVAVGGRVIRAWRVGAVFGIAAIVVLGPETVKDKAGMGGALRLVGVGGAELRRPGEIEQIEVEDAGLIRGRRRPCFAGVVATTRAIVLGVASAIILVLPIVGTNLMAAAVVAMRAVVGWELASGDVAGGRRGATMIAGVDGNEKHGDEDEQREETVVHGDASHDTALVL